jgi:hypothetical protein
VTVVVDEERIPFALLRHDVERPECDLADKNAFIAGVRLDEAEITLLEPRFQDAGEKKPRRAQGNGVKVSTCKC